MRYFISITNNRKERERESVILNNNENVGRGPVEKIYSSKNSLARLCMHRDTRIIVCVMQK